MEKDFSAAVEFLLMGSYLSTKCHYSVTVLTIAIVGLITLVIILNIIS